MSDPRSDRAAWAEQQSKLLSARRTDQPGIDWPGIGAELDSLADREYARARAYVVFGLAALAKLSFVVSVDPRRRWQSDLMHAQFGLDDVGPALIERLTAEWPALWREACAAAYPDAFHADAGAVERFPDQAPFQWADLMDERRARQ